MPASGIKVTDDDFARQRARLVADQLERRDISDAAVLAAMADVPRHEFVPIDHTEAAYDDRPLAIGCDQTISQPYIVALMAQVAELTGADRVLEIGAGSGYAAAVFSRCAGHVWAVERHGPLAEAARARLARLGFDNVDVIHADGSAGWSPAAPYQAIIVSAAAPDVPRPLVEQLVDGGRLVIPIGRSWGQDLLCVRREGDRTRTARVCPVAFVPLVTESGGSDNP
ncbi:MAG TPA: protein-L-isoaspartate(D-aspartate) O-methyltransferase [Acidimicrobiales bacterium]